MARINQCSICGRNVTDRIHHPECWTMLLEGTLHDVRKHFEDHPNEQELLPSNILMVLKTHNFRSREEIKHIRKVEGERVEQKHAWNLKRTLFIDETMEKWEQENPDPDQPQYRQKTTEAQD